MIPRKISATTIGSRARRERSASTGAEHGDAGDDRGCRTWIDLHRAASLFGRPRTGSRIAARVAGERRPMEVAMKAGTRIGAALACALATGSRSRRSRRGRASVRRPTANARGRCCALSTAEQRTSAPPTSTRSRSAQPELRQGQEAGHEVPPVPPRQRRRRRALLGVKGYSCNEKKLDSSPQLLQAKAKCEKGSKKFKQTFGETPDPAARIAAGRSAREVLVDAVEHRVGGDRRALGVQVDAVGLADDRLVPVDRRSRRGSARPG